MIQTGLANYIAHAENYRNRKIGLIANQSSVHAYRYSWDILKEKGADIIRIFSPEHGLFSTEQDQVPVHNQPDVPIEVVSLYKDSYGSLFPGAECLKDIDTLLFDMQDVGSRYYTYVNTMVYMMKAIDKSGIQFIVLDRPNPLGGRAVEGPVLNRDYESFVGVLPVPVRHGLTAGELANFAKEIYRLDIDLKIVKMTGWERDMHYPVTGLPWIPPSPNMPGFETSLVYPGSCLFEGLNVSEGRGTTTPFQAIGAPFVDPYKLVSMLNHYSLPGVSYRPVYFIPTFHKYINEISGGIFIHVTDRDEFRPFRTGILIIKCIFDLCGDLKFLSHVYEFNSIHPTFDLLTGGSSIREMLQGGESYERIAGSWEDDEKDFLKMKEGYHLY